MMNKIIFFQIILVVAVGISALVYEVDDSSSGGSSFFKLQQGLVDSHEARLMNFRPAWAYRMIHLRKAQHAVRLDYGLIEMQAKQILSICGCKNWSMSISLTNDTEVRNLNRMYRQKDKHTDILSFPNHRISPPKSFPFDIDNLMYGVTDQKKHDDILYSLGDAELGDIVISIPYVNRQCYQQGWKLTHRLPVLLTHGFCHLIGYDHEIDEDYQRMQEAEMYILDRINSVDMKLGGALE